MNCFEGYPPLQAMDNLWTNKFTIVRQGHHYLVLSAFLFTQGYVGRRGGVCKNIGGIPGGRLR